jgi:hypothetical protein
MPVGLTLSPRIHVRREQRRVLGTEVVAKEHDIDVRRNGWRAFALSAPYSASALLAAVAVHHSPSVAARSRTGRLAGLPMAPRRSQAAARTG